MSQSDACETNVTQIEMFKVDHSGFDKVLALQACKVNLQPQIYIAALRYS